VAVSAVVDRASSAILVAVPPVLDLVVASGPHHSGYLGPFFAYFSHLHEDELALFGIDGFLAEAVFQLLVISLAALLCGAAEHAIGDLDPVLRAMCVDLAHEDIVLGSIPRSTLVFDMDFGGNTGHNMHHGGGHYYDHEGSS
jgi:hypothetical protein